MSENMTDMDWTTPESLAELVAEELAGVLERAGIRFIGVGCGLEGDDVTMAFQSLRDAELMVELGVPHDDTIGSFYDRATASCLTLTALGAQDEPVEDSQVDDAIDAGWQWTVHPDRSGKGNRVAWHVSVDMSTEDAHQLTANLNAQFLTGDR